NGDAQMKVCQDVFFDCKYYMPAYNWFTLHGFTLPLSMLVIYDSFVYSGGIPEALRSTIPTAVPSNGGDEKYWIGCYIKALHELLSSKSNETSHDVAFRTKCLAEQVCSNNWNLSDAIRVKGVLIK